MDLLSVVTITAPSATDGRGEVAVLNSSADSNFVGWLYDASGFDGPDVRTSMDPIPEGHGATFGSFYHGPRPFTLEILLRPAATTALSMARRDKLYRAFNAMGANGSLVWTETGGSARLLNFRREQPPRGPDKEGHVLLAGIAADPRIYANTAQTGSSPKTNAGNVGSPPTFTLTPSGGNVVITNTTGGYGSPAVTLTVGAGFLVSGTSYIVNFGARSVTRASDGVVFSQAVVFPTSTWWEVIPGANTWTITNTSSASVSFRDAWL